MMRIYVHIQKHRWDSRPLKQAMYSYGNLQILLFQIFMVRVVSKSTHSYGRCLEVGLHAKTFP
jgi:hypothetical protein